LGLKHFRNFLNKKRNFSDPLCKMSQRNYIWLTLHNGASEGAVCKIPGIKSPGDFLDKRTLTWSLLSLQHPYPSFKKVKLGSSERGRANHPSRPAGSIQSHSWQSASLSWGSLPKRLQRNPAWCQILIPLQNRAWSCLTSSIPAKPLPAALPSKTVNHHNDWPDRVKFYLKL
jgi:hypothetical protein